MKQVLILLSVILFASCSSYKATDGMSKEQRQMQKEAEKKAQAAEDMACTNKLLKLCNNNILCLKPIVFILNEDTLNM